MNKDLRLSNVFQIVILAIILILGSLYASILSFLLVIVPVLFAIIGTLSSKKNNIISLLTTFLILFFLIDRIYLIDIFINSIIPGLIIGIAVKKILKSNTSNKYSPIFIGTIVFMISTIIHYILLKYLFKVDLLQDLLDIISQSIKQQREIFKSGISNELLDTSTMLDMTRNLISSMLFCKSIILSIVVYFIEVFTLKKMKYENLSNIKFTYFYLPGNAILISFVLYLLMMILSTIDTPLYINEIFLNVEIIFNFMFGIQGLSVCIYFIKKWIKQELNIKLLIGVILGFVLDVNISDKFSPYMSVAILACLDSVFGAIRANLSKTFQPDIFISGFFGNALLAALLAYLGDKLGIPIYIAAVIVFGGRIFDNFAIIRRLLLEQIKNKKKDVDKKRLRDKENLSDA